MSPEAWISLTRFVIRLGYLADRAGGVIDVDLARRIEVLDRAVVDREPSGFPDALGTTGRVPPASVEAWTYGGTSADALAEVAVWLLADAACDLAANDDLAALRRVTPALDAWAEVLLPTETPE